MSYQHYAVVLLLAWLAYRMMTVVVLPFVRERGGVLSGVRRSGRVRHAAPAAREAEGGLATIIPGIVMLSLIGIWVIQFTVRYAAGQQPFDAASLSMAVAPALVGLGLLTLAVQRPARDPLFPADGILLLVLAIMLASSPFGYRGGEMPIEQRWLTAALPLLAALALGWRLLGSAIVALQGERGSYAAWAKLIGVGSGLAVGILVLTWVLNGLGISHLVVVAVALSAVVIVVGAFGYSGGFVLGSSALVAVLLGDSDIGVRLVRVASASPEIYLLVSAIFSLAIGRAAEAHRGNAPPSAVLLETRPSSMRIAVAWLVAALASLPRAISSVFAGGRHVSLAMLFPFGIPLLLMGTAVEMSTARLAVMMGLPFLAMLALCVLQPRAEAVRRAGQQQPTASGQAFPVLAAAVVLVTGMGTGTESLALAAGLSCLLLGLSEGWRSVLAAQSRTAADVAVLTTILIAFPVLFRMWLFTPYELFAPLEEVPLVGMLFLVVVAALGALLGTTACVLVAILLIWSATGAFGLDLVTFPVPLLLAAETGRYARVTFQQSCEGDGVDWAWIIGLGLLALATMALPQTLLGFSGFLA